MSDLHPTHLADLQKSGLTPDTIAQLKIRDVSPGAIKIQGVLTAYELRYFHMDGKPNGFTRLKLFPPIQRDGHTQKYHQKKGTDPHPYFPPLIDWQNIASEVTRPISITEGEKKAAALCQNGIPCIGIAGVWNWRTKLDDGERCTCPELDQFIWQGREVEVIPDSDGWLDGKRFDVLSGFFALAMDLVHRGAKVKFLKLPEIVPGVKCGLDDWLVRKGGTWDWEWASLERVSLEDPRLRTLAGWWQNWEKRQHQPTPQATTAPTEALSLGDDGNALRFLAQHALALKYVPEWKNFFNFDERRFTCDRGDVMELAKATSRSILIEAGNESDDTRRRDLTKHAKNSDKLERLRAMITLASTDPRVRCEVADFDANPWLLNCGNGTIDLQSGALRPHRREDLITKLIPLDYDPNAQCPRWLAFLDRIFRDEDGFSCDDLIAYLQRLLGYCLTGVTKEQIQPIFFGTGANGKSVTLRVVHGIMNDYAKAADFSTFATKRSDRLSNDLARLCGARLVSACEGDDGAHLSESLIKKLTGGDPITARFMFKEFFEFTPTFKVILVTNHKPIIKTTDRAIRRRIHLVPFSQVIPSEEQDRHLPEKLQAEYPGILTWMVQGCLAWQAQGLGMPDAVKEATETYLDEMDTVGNFLRDRCVLEGYAKVKSSALYSTYQDWCRDNGEQPLSQTKFSLRLKEKGFQTKRETTGQFWQKVGLLHEGDGE